MLIPIQNSWGPITLLVEGHYYATGRRALLRYPAITKLAQHTTTMGLPAAAGVMIISWFFSLRTSIAFDLFPPLILIGRCTPSGRMSLDLGYKHSTYVALFCLQKYLPEKQNISNPTINIYD